MNTIFKTEIKGQPVPLPRPRKGNGGFYNPSSKQLTTMKKVLLAGLESTTAPVFDKSVPLSVTVQFYMKRSIKHFRGEKRSGEIRTGMPIAKIDKPDIDNLVKFVIDGMTGVVYDDDCQIVELRAVKLYDSEGDCMGRTVIEVSRFI